MHWLERIDWLKALKVGDLVQLEGPFSTFPNMRVTYIGRGKVNRYKLTFPNGVEFGSKSYFDEYGKHDAFRNKGWQRNWVVWSMHPNPTIVEAAFGQTIWI